MFGEGRYRIFKDCARGYQNNILQVQRYNDQLKMLQMKMENVHSLSFEAVATSSAKNGVPLASLIQEKSLLENEQQYYKDLNQWVDEVIESIHGIPVKALVWMSCVQGTSLTEIADKYYISRETIYRARRKHLEAALSDEMMAKYYEIQSRRPAL